MPPWCVRLDGGELPRLGDRAGTRDAGSSDEPAYGGVFHIDPLQKPDAVLTGDRLRLVPAHLARRNTAVFRNSRLT